MKVQVHSLVGSAVALAAASILVGCPRMGPGTDGGNIGIDSGGGACGNGVIDPGEQCDPPNGTTCDVDCTTIGGAICGNSIVEIGEQCDPPNGTTCSATCQNSTNPNPPNPGAPCTADADCSAGGTAGLQAACINEAMFGWPMGYCLIAMCTINPMTGTDNCPTSSHCEGFGDGMGGTVNYCLPDCTPTATGIGGCRADTSATEAYTCLPSVIDPAVGGCWLGCETDLGCNPCDTMAGNCFNDTATACTTDADCMASPLALSCNTTVNLCYNNHAAGPNAIGDPCTTDLDCPANAACATGGMVWPGGYCTQFYCDSYGSIPEFQCPAGSVCPSTNGWFGGLLQLCASPCTVAAGAADLECDTNRGDNNDYECFEANNNGMVMTVGELFDTVGTAGFCFQCEAFFMGCP